jgi:hypothetical protein
MYTRVVPSTEVSYGGEVVEKRKLPHDEVVLTVQTLPVAPFVKHTKMNRPDGSILVARTSSTAHTLSNERRTDGSIAKLASN